MTVNTKKAERRTLRFESPDEIAAELDRLESAHSSAGLRHTGNYTPGQVCHHLARWIEMYETGNMPPKPPWPVRVMGRLMKGSVVKKGFPPGMGGPGNKPQPEPDVSFEEGLKFLREKLPVLTEMDLAHRSPFFGPMTHEESVALHLRHAELHLGFLHPA